VSSAYIGPDGAKELDAIFKAAVENSEELTQWENDFVSDVVNRLEEHGERLLFSPKQWEVVFRIRKKLGME
jgi:hypothetical protein